MTIRVQNPDEVIDLLGRLRTWGAANSPFYSAELIPSLFRVEAILHDICHAVTSGFRLPPKGRLETYVAFKIKKKFPRRYLADSNEIRTLAAECLILEALGQKYCGDFLDYLQPTLNILNLQCRVRKLMSSEESHHDAKRVLSVIRRHGRYMKAVADAFQRHSKTVSL